MSKIDEIISLHPWLAWPAGQELLEWEQQQMDRMVSDIFGFHALQLGLPELQALRTNRMQHRWLALDAAYQHWRAGERAGPEGVEPDPTTPPWQALSILRCDFESLPFPSSSLDLVVLPHALELARDPHHTLREVERVLVPDGRVVVVGFNPASLWGLAQTLGRWGVTSSAVLPHGEPIAYWRLRDWLRLLDLEVEAGCFGCYRPFVRRSSTWDRLRWMEAAGDRWWPVFGAVYVLVAVKRVRAMRLVGRLKPQRVPAPAAAVATQRQGVGSPLPVPAPAPWDDRTCASGAVIHE